MTAETASFRPDGKVAPETRASRGIGAGCAIILAQTGDSRLITRTELTVDGGFTAV